MSRWGVGPLFTVISVACSAGAVAVRVLAPERFRFATETGVGLLVAGGILLVLGIAMAVAALSTLHPAFTQGRLVTTGVYRVCRHPIYGCWVVLIVPGGALLLNTWLLLIVAGVMWVLLRALVVREERWLEETFGDEYRAYRGRVPAVLPLGWLRGRAPDSHPR